MKTPQYLLDEREIRTFLTHQNLELSVLKSVSSTNDFPKNERPAGVLQFRLAEYQTKGRGRFHRPWMAPFAANILISCRCPIAQDLSRYGGLSLCIGLAIVQALRKFGLEDLSCKWPNDILHRGQKLAGILIELQNGPHGATHAIIGVGCNVNMSKTMLKAIDRLATSLQVLVGSPQNRNHIAALFIDAISAYLARFEQKGFADFESEWKCHDALAGKDIHLHLGASTVTGRMSGVNATGHLLLSLPSGEIKSYSAGEASLSCLSSSTPPRGAAARNKNFHCSRSP